MDRRLGLRVMPDKQRVTHNFQNLCYTHVVLDQAVALTGKLEQRQELQNSDTS